MGGYEGDVRKNHVVDTDRFSLYVAKLKGFHDIIAIIPPGTVIILLSAIFSIFFNSWMVMVLARYQTIDVHIFYQSLKDLISIVTKEKDKIKIVILIFVLTSIISVVEFILTNIAILPVSNSLNLYLFQFVISGIIEILYFPFFLVSLFLILSPRIFAQ